MPERIYTASDACSALNIQFKTFQHYIDLGFVSPSYETKGGRRLYTDADLDKLRSIMSSYGKRIGSSPDPDGSKINIRTLAVQAGISVDQLRALDKGGAFCPAERVANGMHLYTPEQVDTLLRLIADGSIRVVVAGGGEGAAR